MDKEEEEKEKFIFALFSSVSDSATIAAGKEPEKAAAGEPDRTGYNTGTLPRTPLL